MPTRPQFHKPRFSPPKHDATRGTSTERGYDATWRRARDHHLREHPLCAVCESRGRTTAAVLVDHIVPIAVDPSRRLDPTNFRSCCTACHAAITGNFKRTGINEPPTLAEGFWA